MKENVGNTHLTDTIRALYSFANKTPEEIAVIVERSEEYVKEVLGI